MSLQYRIFNKTGDLKQYWEENHKIHFTEEDEMWWGFNRKRETLFIDKIRNKDDIKR